MYFLHFLLLSFSIFHKSSGQCGVPASSVSLIVNGNNFNRGAWPWMAALMLRTDEENKFFCGAVLVSSTKAITAAHCIQEKNRERLKTRDIWIRLGVYDLSDRNENGVYSTTPKEIIIHPDWNPFSEKYDADIAAIILEDEVPSSKFIKPVCLASKSMDIIEGYVTGWGKSEDSTKAHENIPKELKIPIWTNEHCFLENADFARISSKRTFCGGSRGGEGVCNGDSGGGYYVRSNGVFFLKGLISSSLLKDGKCDVSNFAVFTDITKFLDWIDAPTEQVSSKMIQLSNSCGIMSSSAGLIQKGVKSTNVQWPWVVVIFKPGYSFTIENDTYSSFEVGTLISDKFVIGDAIFLTEMNGEGGESNRKPLPTGQIKTYFGVINVDDYAKTHTMVLDGAESITLHPDFGKIHSLKFANLALLKLKQKVTFSQYISPACISSFSDDPYTLTGRFAYAVGMGYSETGRTKDRKHSTMRIRNKEVCDDVYNFSLGTAKNRSLYFCAGGDAKSSACWSDHPLYMKFDGKWYLHAFLQVAFNDGTGCQTKLPILYEIAGHYYHWIQNQVGAF